MNNERINVHYINAELNTIWDKTKEKDFPPMNRHMVYGILVDKVIAELKKMYEREDALVSAIKELCDSEDSTGCSGDLTVVSLDPMLKLYELTSE